MKLSKYILVTVFLLIVLAPVIPVFALSQFDPGGQYNPLYFKEVSTNESKISDLKSQYGVTAYNDCYRQSGAIGKDTSDPSVLRSYLSWIEYCLEKKITQGQNNQQQDTCASGYEWNSNKTSCVKIVVCPPNSYIDPFWESKGLRTCKCISGFVLQDGQCITNTAYCQQLYGAHSVAQKDQYQQDSCGCESGYRLNLSSDKQLVGCIKVASNTSLEPSNSVSQIEPETNSQINPPKILIDNSQENLITEFNDVPIEPLIPPIELGKKQDLVIENVTGLANSLSYQPKSLFKESQSLFGLIYNFFLLLFKK
ncbi:MAG: hypothetical protein ABIJ81_01910 [Patescibacteria group bacterium]